MMVVVEYLNELLKSYTCQEVFDKLTEEYSIKISSNPKYPDLICLNYDQIESPKFDPITRECRSLVLSLPKISNNDASEPPFIEKPFEVVSRSFDRFFNEGEDPELEYDITELTAYEKVDGSLISLFNYNGEWLYRTRSMIMPDEDLKINGTTTSWKELIESEIIPCDHFMVKGCTYIFEIVSPENRVVTRYPERKAYLLQIRNNISGNYGFYEYNRDVAAMGGWKHPKQYKFDTLDHCLQSAKELRDLQEGYVMYNRLGEPCLKVKNPAYVAAHHLRGEGVLSGKRIMDLIFMNEQDEYLSIFPEDKSKFEPYIESLDRLTSDYLDNVHWCKSIEDQKSFALLIKDKPVCGLLFSKRKNLELTFKQLFDNLTTPAKYRLMESYLEK